MLVKVLFFFVLFIAILSLLMKVKGLELFIQPFFSLFQKLLEFVVASAGSWVLWFVQGILHAHRVVITHLLHDEEYFDIELHVERSNRRS